MSNKSQGSAGRFGVRYGQSAKKRTSAIEAKQKMKQHCIFCNGRAKRLSKGIWLCKKCGKKFAGHAYFLESKTELTQAQTNEGKPESKEKAKILKKENSTNIVDNATKTKKPRKSKAKSTEKTE
ncbi:MAG: hypothetical protein AABX17_02980 [Nanoarchaeota archaeon]